jgi:hypothetical protein
VYASRLLPSAVNKSMLQPHLLQVPLLWLPLVLLPPVLLLLPLVPLLQLVLLLLLLQLLLLLLLLLLLCKSAPPGGPTPVQHSRSSSVLSPAHRISCGRTSLMCFTIVPAQNSQEGVIMQPCMLGRALLCWPRP